VKPELEPFCSKKDVPRDQNRLQASRKRMDMKQKKPCGYDEALEIEGLGR
jgi:hypothetical protein